jgi:hypothetical protein
MSIWQDKKEKELAPVVKWAKARVTVLHIHS